MRTTRRRGLTLLDLLAALAVLAILGGLFLPAVQMVRDSANRAASSNNLRQIAIAVHNYETVNNVMPPGNDPANFSTFAKLLPYIEQENLFRVIDFTAPMDAKANDRARAMRIKTFLSPRDPVLTVREDAGATNYLFCAGSNPDLTNNNGPFFPNSKQGLGRIPDGSSNTAMCAETLKGDGGTKPVTVQRQHVRLKANDLAKLRPDFAEAEWKAAKNIAGDRGASWMDGRFLQTLFTGTLAFHDTRPDVDCGGAGGYSALRNLDNHVLVVMCDGAVRDVSARRVSLQTWRLVVDTRDGMVIPDDW